MKLDQSPSFRKVTTPWHYSTFFYIVISVFMTMVFLFSNVGLRYAITHEKYWQYRWVPILLMVLSAAVLVVNLTRVVVRMIRRRSEDDD